MALFTARVALPPLTEDEGFDEQGLVTPLCLCTPEDRAAWKEEHMIDLLRHYGMTAAEAAAHIYFATRLDDE